MGLPLDVIIRLPSCPMLGVNVYCSKGPTAKGKNCRLLGNDASSRYTRFSAGKNDPSRTNPYADSTRPTRMELMGNKADSMFAGSSTDGNGLSEVPKARGTVTSGYP